MNLRSPISNYLPAQGGNLFAMLSFFKKPFSTLLFITFGLLPFTSFSQSSSGLEQELNQKLAEINATITTYRAQIGQLSKITLNLQQEISLLDKKNQTIELQIQAGQLTLQDLKLQASQLKKEITLLEGKINETKDKLSGSMTTLYQYDQRSGIEMILSGNQFSDFFDQFHYVKRLGESIKENLDQLAQGKARLDDKEEVLGQRLASQERILALQSLEQQEIENNKSKKNALVAKNSATTSILSQKSSALQEVANQLRQKLYVLKGLSASTTLSDARQKAQAVAAKVSIDPNFLMAILKVESDLGSDVGGGNWQVDMHPRDRAAFAKIAKDLGLDPDTTPVSSRPGYGWGGAMGPAQFLPSVWLSYQERIAGITRHRPPNPWDLEDAFAAAAIKLSSNGADQKTPEGEWGAAMKYFAGSHWQNPAYSFYGDRVMAVKDLIAQAI